MDILSRDAFAAALPDLDFDLLGSLVGFEFTDLDLGEFWDGNVDVESFLAAPTHVGKDDGLGLGLDGSGGGGEGRESSPDSVVTEDGGAPESESGGSEMSAYVSDLERFLMGDNDGDDVDETGGETAAKEDVAPDEYFFGDSFVGDGAEATGAEEEEEELNIEDYFFDEFFVADDGGCGEPVTASGVDDAEATRTEEEAADEYFSGDFYVAEPASGAGVCPAAAASSEEDATAREDEAPSSKRASIHLLRQMQSSC